MSYKCARAKLSAQSDFVYLSVYYLYIVILYGDVAQLARAPALQAGGQEFDSPYLHQMRSVKWEVKGETLRKSKKRYSLNIERKDRKKWRDKNLISNFSHLNKYIEKYIDKLMKGKLAY